VIPNRKPGGCVYCQAPVGEGNGWAFCPAGMPWQLSCAAEPCVKLAREAEGRFARRELTADGCIAMPYDPAALPVLRSFPGAWWDAGQKCWHVSIKTEDRPKVLELAGRLGLTVAPELSRHAALVRDALVSQGLYQFQADGVIWLRSRKRALLGDSMGLGKTPQALLALDARAGSMVICPASLKLNWRDECKRWRRDLTPTVLNSKGEFRVPRAGELLITNYERLPKAPDKGKKLPPEHALTGCTLIVDEATMASNRKAARTRSVRALARSTTRTWLLTGTPMLNRPLDLYGLLDTGGMAKEAFGGWPNFLRLFDADHNEWGGLVFGKPSAETPKLLRRVMLRRLKEEVLPDLPKLRWTEITADLDDQALLGRLDAAWDAWNMGGQLDELPSFAEVSRVRAALAASRVPAMLDIVERYEESETPLVVFSAHRAPIDALKGREGWAVITGDEPTGTRYEAVSMFQRGLLNGIGLTVKAGGFGLTLTRASDVLFVDLSYVPAENAQAADRVRRIGQTASSVLVSVLVSDHALDRRVHAILRAKQRLIDQSIEQTTRAP
jgi:SWI/SNF-related matrix-associated actin-dependent regulator 1 of chromatin subfamily A